MSFTTTRPAALSQVLTIDLTLLQLVVAQLARQIADATRITLLVEVTTLRELQRTHLETSAPAEANALTVMLAVNADAARNGVAA